MRLRVGTYNLLCPTYGVKWGEREACLDWRSKDEHGLSNWEQRWPALRRVIQAAPWDLLALEELEDSTRADVEAACDGLGLRLAWFPHAGRSDALGLAYDPRALCAEESARIGPRREAGGGFRGEGRGCADLSDERRVRQGRIGGDEAGGEAVDRAVWVDKVGGVGLVRPQLHLCRPLGEVG